MVAGDRAAPVDLVEALFFMLGGGTAGVLPKRLRGRV
jgi:hypothetical protein